MFEKPGVIGPASKFFASVTRVFEHPDAYDRFSTKASVGLSYELTREQSVSAELSLEYAGSSRTSTTRRQSYLIASMPLQYVYDNRDDKLEPEEGLPRCWPSPSRPTTS